MDEKIQEKIENDLDGLVEKLEEKMRRECREALRTVLGKALIILLCGIIAVTYIARWYILYLIEKTQSNEIVCMDIMPDYIQAVFPILFATIAALLMFLGMNRLKKLDDEQEKFAGRVDRQIERKVEYLKIELLGKIKDMEKELEEKLKK